MGASYLIRDHILHLKIIKKAHPKGNKGKCNSTEIRRLKKNYSSNGDSFTYLVALSETYDNQPL